MSGKNESMVKVEQVTVCGAVLEAGRDPTNKVQVVVKRVCEALGISDEPQRRKLHEAEWACTTIMVALDSRGRKQEVFCIDLDSLPMWLVTIHASKVAPEARERLVLFQREAKAVLARHFLGETATAAPVMAQPDQAALLARIEELTALVASIGRRPRKARLVPITQGRLFNQHAPHAAVLAAWDTVAHELHHDGAMTPQEAIDAITEPFSTPARERLHRVLLGEDAWVAKKGRSTLPVRIGALLRGLRGYPAGGVAMAKVEGHGQGTRWGVRRIEDTQPQMLGPVKARADRRGLRVLPGGAK